MKKLLLFIFFASIILYGQDPPGDTDHQNESNMESWYTYWGLGLSVLSYPSELQKIIDLLGTIDEVSNTSLNMDMFGFYWHIEPKTIAGFVVNGSGDRYMLGEEYVQIDQYIYGLSVIRYLSDSFGKGFFLRGDAGIAVLSLTSSFGD
ncbi:MAG: hypothetical protein GQ534_09595, partial [Candidatus Delongbacteria bacterium]|nr:hypothetical protein [Candidatus Delongbacteria bacterium]